MYLCFGFSREFVNFFYGDQRVVEIEGKVIRKLKGRYVS